MYTPAQNVTSCLRVPTCPWHLIQPSPMKTPSMDPQRSRSLEGLFLTPCTALSSQASGPRGWQVQERMGFDCLLLKFKFHFREPGNLLLPSPHPCRTQWNFPLLFEGLRSGIDRVALMFQHLRKVVSRLYPHNDHTTLLFEELLPWKKVNEQFNKSINVVRASRVRFTGGRKSL